MRHLSELGRLVAIMLISPAVGFGTLAFLDAARIATPQNVDKGGFVLFGFVVAIATAIILFRVFPSKLTTPSTHGDSQSSED